VDDICPADLTELFRGSSADSIETTVEAVGVVIVPIVWMKDKNAGVSQVPKH